VPPRPAVDTGVRMRPYRDLLPLPASTPPSPCVRNCCLDDDDVCLGCGRHLQEILRWRDASESEREAILLLAQERRERRERNAFQPSK